MYDRSSSLWAIIEESTGEGLGGSTGVQILMKHDCKFSLEQPRVARVVSLKRSSLPTEAIFRIDLIKYHWK